MARVGRIGRNGPGRKRSGATAPGPVLNLQAYALSEAEIQLFYSPASGSTEHYYNISSSLGSFSDIPMPANGLITGLAESKLYTISVYGSNASGPGVESDPVNATTYLPWRIDGEVLENGLTAVRIFDILYDDGFDVTLNGSQVSSWNDKSTYGAHLTQATTANQPPYSSTSRNSKPAIEYDGVTDILSSSTVTGLPGSQAATSVIYAVFGESDLAAFRYFINFNGSATFQLGSGGSGFPRYQSAGGNMSNTGLTLINNDAIVSFKCPAGSSVTASMAINGNTPVTATLARAASTHSSLSFGGPTAHIKGKALYVIDGQISDADEARAVGSLAWAYNHVTSLPSDYVFKLAKPYSSHETAYVNAVANTDITILEDWFKTYSGPTVAITGTVSGQIDVTNQTEADALIGMKVIGWVNVTAPVWLHDFIVEFDETLAAGSALAMVSFGAAATDSWINNVRVDGKLSKLSIGIGGVGYVQGITVEHCDVTRCGFDGLRAHKNSFYRYNYIHDMRGWDDLVDGTYVGDGDQTIYPHTDGIQVQRTGNTIERNWFGMQVSSNTTSAVMCKTESVAEVIDSVVFDRNYFGGASNYTVHIVADPLAITAATLTNNIFSRDFGGNVAHASDPIADGTLTGGILTASGNMWADDFTTISGY